MPAAIFSHCLRPTLTETLLQRLQRGASVNVLTADEADARRLFEDVQALVGAEVYLVRVSLRGYSKDFGGFLRDVWQQLPEGVR